ncbi:MAG: cytochrome c-type biogenesis protein CcmH [Gammaproteobacteria bacterium]|nr:cytochrome c-type biogenesis protein CcmH [Gammaproteobacteria bacterium]MCW9003907.1 cytochrome c-type biogenesis protein CcmH [Gammaproteobacteria bacterium]MCW9056256.1 cytochrome c-type biogenesis protein CcmH [Gammaproteobacteria bacterium]
MKSVITSLVLSLSVFLALPAQAKIELHEFSNEQMKDDYYVLMAELRCLVCQNQNLADSNAELAQDLRQQVYEMLDKGSSREDVVDFMVTRYGDFVLYRPPVKTITLLLWFGPAVMFLIALSIVFVFYRKQKKKAEVELSDQQKQRAHSLLDD